MNPGKLNKKIIIQKKISSNPLDDIQYIDYKKCWASIYNLPRVERLEAQKVNPNISKKLNIRYIEELDPSLYPNSSNNFRVQYKNNFYNILYIDNVEEKNKLLELMLEVT